MIIISSLLLLWSSVASHTSATVSLVSMHKYFIKTPWIVKQLFPNYIWSMPANENKIYLSFDDGPHPQITPWVLDELAKYNAKGSFFCIGKNVSENVEVFNRIKYEEHTIGNHTYNHINGWKTKDDVYLVDIAEAGKIINSKLFRPPYGRIKQSQAKSISSQYNIIMWDVLSADFDVTISPQKCLDNVLQNVTAGSIIVFHDSEKAFKNLEYVLPVVLKEWSGKYDFAAL